MSRKEGHLADPEVQQKLAEVDRTLQANEVADMERVLRADWGRRFYYRLVHEYGALYGDTFDSGIRDGACLAAHMAHKAGIQHVGRILMLEAQRHFPELWRMAVNERLAKAEADARQRENIKNRPQGKVEHE